LTTASQEQIESESAEKMAYNASSVLKLDSFPREDLNSLTDEIALKDEYTLVWVER
jgi:hypothetical protein